MKLTATVVDATKETQPEPKYPCLMRSVKSGNVVLFQGPNVGTVVRSAAIHPLGHVNRDWYMPGFEPFYGSVTLESKP